MTGPFCYLVGLSLFFEDILGAANWGGGGGDRGILGMVQYGYGARESRERE